MIRLPLTIRQLFDPPHRDALAAAIATWLPRCRWFAGKARAIQRSSLQDWAWFPAENNDAEPSAAVTLVAVQYVDGGQERYLLPLVVALRHRAPENFTATDIAEIVIGDATQSPPLTVADGGESPEFCQWCWQLVATQAQLTMYAGAMRGAPTAKIDAVLEAMPADRQSSRSLAVRSLGQDQSNTAVVLGERVLLKLIRRLEVGENPDAEIGRCLTEQADFAGSPPLVGSLDYHSPDGSHTTLAVLWKFLPNATSAWTKFLALAAQYCRSIAASANNALQLLQTAQEQAQRLALRTAQLHRALSLGTNAAFSPTPWSAEDMAALQVRLQQHARETLTLVRAQLSSLPADLSPDVERLLNGAPVIDARYAALADLGKSLRIERAVPADTNRAPDTPHPSRDTANSANVAGLRIRCHGDYHLGQVLATSDDYIIIDFEGEPTRSIAERRAKQSPLRDVAGMVRSFHYASVCALGELRKATADDLAESRGDPAIHEHRVDADPLDAAAGHWYQSVSTTFVDAYRAALADSPLLPPTAAATQRLLDVFLLEKALYELAYELNNRPAWVRVPLAGILGLLGAAHA